MITEKLQKQINKLAKDDVIFIGKNGVTTVAIIGNYEDAKDHILLSVFDWDTETANFVKNTSPKQREEIARLAKIHALEKELEQLKAQSN
jgi:hypothetical protein